MKFTFEQLFIDQKQRRPEPVLTADLTGKVVLITGANTGLGYEAAKHFAGMNPLKLIIACRDEQKGKTAVDKIKKETSFDRIELRIVDLFSLESIKDFKQKFDAEVQRLDIFVANAALGTKHYQLSKQEIETTIQVNDVGTAYLALLLLPNLITTAEEYKTTPRLTFVSSDIHYFSVPFTKEILEAKSPRGALSTKEVCTPEHMSEQRYTLSKLLNIFFYRALHDHLPSAQPTVTITAVNPGFCYSELRREATGEQLAQYQKMEEQIAYTSEEGARSIVWAALAHSGSPSEEEKIRGQYTSLARIQEVDDYVLSEEGAKAQDAFWDDLLKILSEYDRSLQATLKNYLLNV